MSRFRSFQRTVVALAVVAGLAFTAPSAFAGGNGAFTQTVNLHSTPGVPGQHPMRRASGRSAEHSAKSCVTVNTAGDVWSDHRGLDHLRRRRPDATDVRRYSPSGSASATTIATASCDTFNVRATADGSGATLNITPWTHRREREWSGQSLHGLPLDIVTPIGRRSMGPPPPDPRIKNRSSGVIGALTDNAVDSFAGRSRRVGFVSRVPRRFSSPWSSRDAFEATPPRRGGRWLRRRTWGARRRPHVTGPIQLPRLTWT